MTAGGKRKPRYGFGDSVMPTACHGPAEAANLTVPFPCLLADRTSRAWPLPSRLIVERGEIVVLGGQRPYADLEFAVCSDRAYRRRCCRLYRAGWPTIVWRNI